MKAAALSTFVLASVSLVAAQSQAGAWGQCGGSGWTGATTCVSGYTCSAVNQWYSQCIPGSSVPSTSSTTTTTTITTPTTTATQPGATQGGTDLPYGTLVTGCSKSGTVAITFDDGPYTWTSGLIDSLNAANVSATFFVVGQMYGCIYNYADVIQKAYNSGHQIASHTWSHKDLTGQSASGIQTEISRVEVALKKILGIRPKWLRPPYGGQNSNVLSTMRGLNYKVVTWNLDSEDWNGLSVSASQNKFNSLGADPKIIPLEHDALQSTAQQLGPWIANWAKNKGLKAVTLSECLGESIPGGQYEQVGGATPRDNTWTC
ncbi:carbohydrate deacetylase [Ephemerocybe angulata]|uniref:Carbohydrate deacetylase n=1 Tax=Ephemerocybe angulata TaxID=980116 RepID=A0A8H6M8T5_9AGAR|nr:carbohydrate deacetylase [Tulosesus angulatus]KAF6759200.1 carbohydrate deacetylase [Tulosesus angulatus]